MPRWNGVSKATRKPVNPYPDDWRQRSRSVKERDGFKCRLCGISETNWKAKAERMNYRQKYLIVHHLQSVKTGNNRSTNLITLCPLCHAKQPGHSHLMKNL